MKISFRSSVMVALLFAAAMTLPASSAPSSCPGDSALALDVAIDGADVRIAGATPKGRILVVGYGRGWNAQQYTHRLTKSLLLLSADDRGALTVEGKVTGDSVWTAIDVESGRCGAVGMGAISRRARLGQDAIERRNGGRTSLRAQLPLVHGIVIRPGRGLWEVTAGDGGPKDRDFLQDGRTALALEDMEALGTSGSPPQQLERGDIVLLFSPHQTSMDFTRVEK